MPNRITTSATPATPCKPLWVERSQRSSVPATLKSAQKLLSGVLFSNGVVDHYEALDVHFQQTLNVTMSLAPDPGCHRHMKMTRTLSNGGIIFTTFYDVHFCSLSLFSIYTAINLFHDRGCPFHHIIHDGWLARSRSGHWRKSPKKVLRQQKISIGWSLWYTAVGQVGSRIFARSWLLPRFALRTLLSVDAGNGGWSGLAIASVSYTAATQHCRLLMSSNGLGFQFCN